MKSPPVAGGLFDSRGRLVITLVSLFLYTFGLMITLGAAVLAAYSDVRSFKIPNMATILVVLGFAVAYSGIMLLPPDTEWHFGSIGWHLASAGIFFLITLILFATGSIGAGDAKFASALALWPGLMGLTLYVFYMSLIGGLMGLMTLMLRKWKPLRAPPSGTWLAAAQEGHNRIPYGLAIALGFVLTSWVQGYFDITGIIKLVEKSQ
jgi:prepilin peptidase CpaA